MDIAIYGGVRAPRAAVFGRKKSDPRRNLLALFMGALKETRRHEACREIERYAHLLPSGAELSAAVLSAGRDGASSVVCPITARLCVGDLSHLCKDYGCARKGGLSPHSGENF